jgi:hypothetical protein
MRSKCRSMFVALVAVLALGAVASASASATPGWYVNGVALKAGESRETILENKSGTSVTLEEPASKHTIICTKATGKGKVTGGTPGTGNVPLEFTGCSLNIPECKLAKTVVVKSQTAELLTSGAIIEDEIKQVEIPFTAEGPTCPWTKLTIKGHFGAEVVNTQEVLRLPGPGTELKYEKEWRIHAEISQKLVGGGKLEAK